MGSSANERIALQIDSSADLSGIEAARAGTAKLSASIDQVRLAQERSNGDFEKFKTELAAIVTGENALAAAAAKATTEIQKQASAGSSGPALIGPSGPQLGPGTPGMTTGLAAAASQAASAKVQIDKVPGSARTAANALGMLSQAAISGQGSMAGMATAAGGLATGISMMSGSAQVAASAAGIGALITVAVVAMEVLSKLTATAKNTQVTMDHIGAFTTRQLGGAGIELAAINAQLGAAQQKASDASRGDLPGLPSRGAMAANQELDNLLEKRNALAAKIRELEKTDIQETRDRTIAGITIVAAAQQTALGRYRGQQAVIEAERVEAIRSRSLTESAANARAATERRELAKKGTDYIDALSETNAANLDALTRTSFQARINAADRAAAKEKDDLKYRELSSTDEVAAVTQIELRRKGIVALAERERDTALATSAARRATESDDPRVELEGKLAMIDQEYKADVLLLGVVEALANAEAKRAKLQKETIAGGLAGYSALSNAVKNHGTVVGAMAKAAADAVRLHEIYVEGKKAMIMAKIEGAASIAAFASGNLWGGALHAAAAIGYGAAAVAAGVEAAGVVSSGGGGGSGANGDTSGTFQPTSGGATGAMTIVLQTVNPYSKEATSEVLYQIDRSGVLKRPIPISPTTGLLGAA